MALLDWNKRCYMTLHVSSPNKLGGWEAFPRAADLDRSQLALKETVLLLFRNCVLTGRRQITAISAAKGWLLLVISAPSEARALVVL